MFDKRVDIAKVYGSTKVVKRSVVTHHSEYKKIKNGFNPKSNKITSKKPPVQALTQWWKDKEISKDLKELI